MVLCSKCSESIKPIVALDIDGTMGEFHDHFLRFALGYLYGQPMHHNLHEEYDGSVGFRQWFCKRVDIDYKIWYDIKLAYRQGGMKRTMRAHTWARILTYALREAGVEVWVTTTRPYLRMDNIDPDTRFWLENNDIQFDHLLYDEDKYSQLLQLVDKDRVIAIVDDLPDQLDRAAGIFGMDKCILWRAPHNRYIWDAWPSDQIVHEQISLSNKISDRLAKWESNVKSAV